MNTMTMTLERPTRTVNFAKIQPFFSPVTDTALVPSRAKKGAVTIAAPPLVRAKVALEVARLRPRTSMAQLETRKFNVPKVSGSMSRMFGTAQLENEGVEDLKLPFGMPRFVNVATLKGMLKANPSDILLKKSGERWEACEDSTRVDLLDDSVEFRLGAVQILS